MKKKESSKKLFFRRKRHSKTDEDFQIISNEELFEDVADYDEEAEETEDILNDEEDYEEADPGEESSDVDESVELEEDSSDADESIESDEETEDVEDEGNSKETGDENSEIVEEAEEDMEEVDALENAEDEKEADIEEAEKGSEGAEEADEDDSEDIEEDYAESSWDSEDNEEDFEDSEEDFEEDDIREINLDDDDIKSIHQDDEQDSGKKEITDEEKAQKKQRRKKRLRIASLVIVSILVIAYLGAAGFFYSHFYLNTQINGIDFSLNDATQVQDYMEKQVDDYVLTLKESDGGREKIKGKDIDLRYVRDDSIDKLLKEQNPLLWISALWEAPTIEASVGVEYDKEKLNQVMGKLICMREAKQVPSVSAYPVFVETQFEIQEEKLGTQIDFERFPKAVAEAINSFLPELDMAEAECYVPPVFTTESPEVIAARDAMNGYLGANITLDFAPYTEIIDSPLISQWIIVDENMQVVFNQDAVRGYVASLAEKYDTFGKERTFVTGFGNTVQVSGGNYGWQIDQEAEFNALIANIQNAETVTREPNYARRAVSHEGNDFGNTYAEVDLTNQHMFYFQDGQCILQSNIVTGNPYKGNATPQGVYTLAYKAMNQVLRGKKLPDGTYEYESPVTYWMPFNGGIGFHDASWQAAFGGSRYLTYGSHGCVNMPAGAAGQLYGIIQSGTPVICHY